MTKNHLYQYEAKYLLEGYKYICGTDEAGRGPLAGPVVAAAVIFPANINLVEIDDSKKLSKAKREKLVSLIYDNALSVGIGIVDVAQIDKINIYQASKQAMIMAIKNLSIKPDVVLADAMQLDNYLCEAIIKGDQKSVSIAAASIIAKTTRDKYMEELDLKYPLYGFKEHNGYPTKKHVAAINQYGIIPEHRKTFEPIKSLIKKDITLFD